MRHRSETAIARDSRLMPLRLFTAAIAFLIAEPCFAQPPARSHEQAARDVLVFAPRPEYPLLAREANLSGAGVYILNVNEQTGVVESINVEKRTGHGILDAAAMKALIQWRFKPHTAKRVKIPIQFMMDGQVSSTPRYRTYP